MNKSETTVRPSGGWPDIVARLRDPSLGSPVWSETMGEAADEIERLRRVVSDWTADRRRMLSKQGIKGGFYHHDLVLLEQAMEASDAG